MSFLSLRTAAAAAILSTTAITAPAYAVAFTGTYTVDADFADNGLEIAIDANSGLAGDQHTGNLNFTLNNGQTKYLSNLFKISTPENSVDNGEDLDPQPISVLFAFTLPEVFGGVVNGETVGQKSFLGFYQNGLLTWDQSSYDFAYSGGILNVKLDNNVEFNDGSFWGTGHKGAKVGGKFTLTAVPEPASWAMMITGFGLVGGAMRSRRTKTTVSFA